MGVKPIINQPAQNSSIFPISSIPPSSSVRHLVRDSTDLPKSSTSSAVWSYLTLGIPRLIESLSLFFDGIVHREKRGEPLSIRFTTGHLNAFDEQQLQKFHNYQEKEESNFLKNTELKKAQQLMEALAEVSKQARLEGNETLFVETDKKLKLFQGLIEKNSNTKLKNRQLDEHEWPLLDEVKFELTKEHFEDLVLQFNSEWFRSYLISERMERFGGLDYCEAVIAEILGVSLSYIEGLDGKSIKLPFLDTRTGLFKLVTYTINKTVLGDNLPCYTLECELSEAHPWFVFRGTQRYTTLNSQGKELREGSFESILADVIDYKCVSRRLINKSLVHRPIVKEGEHYKQMESLGDIFCRWRREGKKVLLTGHSLGGTIVNALTVEFFDDVKRGYSFSGTGVSSKIAWLWNSKGVLAKKKLINFNNEGDMIPSGGAALIGQHFAIKPLWVAKKGIYHAHNRRNLNKDFEIQKVNIKKENGKFARAFCERIRIIIGAIFRFFLSLFNPSYLPDWWKNRFVYKKQANLYRGVLKALATA